MPLTWLATSPNSPFPALEKALDDGLLAVGGDLSSHRLMNAYRHGIFPWFNEYDPILWWAPDPRMVLFTDQIKVSKSLQKSIRKSQLTITMDKAFGNVMAACAIPRKNKEGDIEAGTWIHPEMITAYTELHQQGIAHSIECWHKGELVGGLYGLAIGKIFFGESMFSRRADSSKIALVSLCRQLQRWGFPLIDCQVYSKHLASMGAKEVDRQLFINYLNDYCPQSQIDIKWALDADLS
jgi:leucyl/phenylalanyl-tRNA--protein transferase